MIKVFCDRCGLEIPRGAFCLVTVTGAIQNFRTDKIEYNNNLDEHSTYSLCSCCTDSFDSFMDMRKDVLE